MWERSFTDTAWKQTLYKRFLGFAVTHATRTGSLRVGWVGFGFIPGFKRFVGNRAKIDFGIENGFIRQNFRVVQRGNYGKRLIDLRVEKVENRSWRK